MTSDEIRARIVADHDEIRGVLDELESLAKRFAAGDDDAGIGEEIRRIGAGLIEIFAAHLNLEESLLMPVLATIPREGPQLAKRLDREHREQRELLEYLMGRLSQNGRPTTLVAREMENFAGYLRVDMAHEEETVLSEELLA